MRYYKLCLSKCKWWFLSLHSCLPCDSVYLLQMRFYRYIDRVMIPATNTMYWSLQWRHNELGGVSIHQPHDCLLNRLFTRRSKKTSKLRNRWSFRMDKLFHHTLYWTYDYLSMLGLTLIHVSKKGPLVSSPSDGYHFSVEKLLQMIYK